MRDSYWKHIRYLKQGTVCHCDRCGKEIEYDKKNKETVDAFTTRKRIFKQEHKHRKEDA